MKNNWSEEEVVLLKQYLKADMEFKEIALLLKRSKRAIHYKIGRIQNDSLNEKPIKPVEEPINHFSFTRLSVESIFVVYVLYTIFYLFN